MAQTPDSDLAARILAVEAGLRALRSNAANAGGVTFAADPSNVRIDGVLNASATTAWKADVGPFVDVFCPGGRLLIDWAVQHEVFGGTTTAIGRTGYQITGPGLSDGYGLDGTPVVVAADPARAVVTKDRGANPTIADSLASASFFDVTAALPTGWYRVSHAYQLTYNASVSGVPFTIAANRILSVTVL